MINPFTAKSRFLESPTINIIAFVVLEILTEKLYRALVGESWRTFRFKTNAFVDVWVGEGCFFVAVITTITIFSRCKQTFLYLYQGPITVILSGGVIGSTFGLVLSMVQATLLHHFGWYVAYGSSENNFPLTNEVIYCLAIALTEETAFRGYLFPLLRNKQGVGPAVLVTSVLFALGHLSNADVFASSSNLFYTLTVTFSAGLLLALCIVLTKRIWLSIGVHFSVDFFHTLFYGDVSVGVSPIVAAHFSPGRVNQVSLILYVVCSTILLILAIRTGRWKSVSGA